MALKGDRYEGVTDVSFFMNDTSANKGGIVCLNTGGIASSSNALWYYRSGRIRNPSHHSRNSFRTAEKREFSCFHPKIGSKLFRIWPPERRDFPTITNGTTGDPPYQRTIFMNFVFQDRLSLWIIIEVKIIKNGCQCFDVISNWRNLAIFRHCVQT